MSTQSIAFTIDNQSPFTLQLYGTYQHGAMWTGGTEQIAPNTRVQAGWVSNDPPHDRMAGTIGVVVHSEEYQLYLWIGLNADLASANQTAASISDSNTEVGQEWHQMLSEHGQKDVVYQTQTGSHFQVNSYMQPGPNAEAVFSFYLH